MLTRNENDNACDVANYRPIYVCYVQNYGKNNNYCINIKLSAYKQYYLQTATWFLSRVSILTRDIDIANLFVCLSVTFRYQMKTA